MERALRPASRAARRSARRRSRRADSGRLSRRFRAARFYGETAREDGLAAYEAKLGSRLRPSRPPRIAPRRGRGLALGAGLGNHLSGRGRRYPRRRLRIGRGAQPGPPPRRRRASAFCLEALVRLNAMSFEMGNAVMHTTGQAFAMAFQAGGPHAQDRGLEAVATAWAEMTRAPAGADLGEAAGQGRAARHREALAHRPARRRARHRLPDLPDLEQLPRPLRQPRHRQHRDREAAPGRHPAAGADRRRAARPPGRGGPAARRRAPRRRRARSADHQGPRPPPRGAIVDYTGSNAFGAWVRENAGEAQVYTEEAGVNSIVIARQFRLRRHVRQRRLLARALLRPDVHRAAGHLRPPRRHRHRRGPQVLRRGRRRPRRRGRRAPRRPGPRRRRRRRHRQPRDARPRRRGPRGSAASSATAPPSPKAAAPPR